MACDFSIRVLVVCTDFFVNLGYRTLLYRDRRINPTFTEDLQAKSITKASQQPDIENLAEGCPRPDVLLVDLDNCGGAPIQLIAKLRRLFPSSAVVCIGQTAPPEMVQQVLQLGVKAYLVKSEIGLTLTSAIVRASQGRLVLNKSVKIHLSGISENLSGVEVLEEQHKNRDLSDRLFQNFLLFVILGLPAKMVSARLGITESSVSRYNNRAYTTLENVKQDTTDLKGINLANQSPEDIAYHLLVLPTVRKEKK